MPVDLRQSDKAPLRDYVESIVDQFAEAVTAFESHHTGWTVQSANIVARGTLIPMEDPQKRIVVFIDIDEPTKKPICDIPIRLQRTV